MHKPVNDNDWTIHSLNIHGVFFEKLIASIIADHKTVDLLATEYPVEYPLDSPKGQGSDSRLDILARVPYHSGTERGIDLCIECKKANPEFVDWIFFPTAPISYRHIANILSISHAKTDSEGSLAEYHIRPIQFTDMEFADNARETRGTYERVAATNKTKTSNAAISDAAYQVTLATHAIVDHDLARTQRLKQKPSFSERSYIPIIVTTANLLLCEFEPGDTSMTSGEIAFDKTTLKPVKRLFYEYPVAPHLHLRRDDYWLVPRPQDRNKHIRRHILVVNSSDFRDTLDWLVDLADFLPFA
jgi:hypothetical protein